MSRKGKFVDWADDYMDDRGLPADWVTVTEAFGGGYSWAEFRAYWSPTERRYFWHGNSGCSCNSWGSGIRSKADFETGDRAALFAGIQRWEADHWSYRPGPLIDAAADIRTFREFKDYGTPAA